MKLKKILILLTLFTVSIGIIACSSKPSPSQLRIDTLTWIEPSSSACSKNNGVTVKKKGYATMCKSKLEDAPKICEASGGRLPTENEFTNVCKTTTYQSHKDLVYCLKRKGIYYGTDKYSYSWIIKTNKEGIETLLVGERLAGIPLTYNRHDISNYYHTLCVK